MKKFTFQTLMVVLSLAAGGAFAADSTPASSPGGNRRAADPTLDRYEQAVSRQDWAGAQAAMREALAKDPGNADFNNLYAYSLRKGPNPDMSQVFKFYNEALRIDPKHKGAHEYLGEAYLMVGNVDKAKEHLAQLDKLCFFGCSEFNELKKSISDYEAKTAKK